MVVKSGIEIIDGLLSGYAWNGSSVTYAFPDSPYDYSYNGEPDNRFGQISGRQMGAASFALDADYGAVNHANDGFSVEGFTQLDISKGSDTTADIRLAVSNDANPTAYGYFPAGGSIGGDVWFGRKHDFTRPVAGNYEWATILHELGHALGLKHAHLAEFGYGRIPAKYDSLEFTIMTYHATTTSRGNAYTNERYGFPQTYMMADIAALQYMYGADFTTNSGDTVYKWIPTSGRTFVDGGVAINPGANRILATIWDGGGTDTYDLSSYQNSLSIDLRAGGYSVFSQTQKADLNGGSRSGGLARGNIFNAMQYQGDDRSLIENAIGGAGNDKISGNQAANHLWGSSGNDTLTGRAGNDLLTGGSGADRFVFAANFGIDTVTDFQDGIDFIRFVAASLGLETKSEALALAVQDGADVRFSFVTGDEMVIQNMNVANLSGSDILFI